MQIRGGHGVGGVNAVLQRLDFADGLDLAGSLVFLPADLAAVKRAVVVGAAPDLNQAGAFAELGDHVVKQNGDQTLILLEHLRDARDLLVFAVRVELGIEAHDLHFRVLLGHFLQEDIRAVLIAVGDEQAVIPCGSAAVDGVHPGVEIAVAEEKVEIDVQRLAQVGAGILPHLEDGGGRQQHHVSDLLAGDRVLGLRDGARAHGQRQHQSQNDSEDLFHGNPPVQFFRAISVPFCCI